MKQSQMKKKKNHLTFDFLTIVGKLDVKWFIKTIITIDY